MENTGSSFSREIFLDRYALKDEEGNLLESTVEEMWARVAKFASSAEKAEDREKWESKFYSVLEKFRFVPAGRILAASGIKGQTQNNCFVIKSPEDSRSGIIRSLGQWVEIQARGGGVGLNISTLRPRGSRVASVNGSSSGAIAWMELFSSTVKAIQQGGSRRGAGIILLDVSHPDVISFIEAKRSPGILEGVNVSVAISDSFMEAVSKGELWSLVWGGKIYNQVPALEIWNKICESAWASGEPGLFFIDTVNRFNPTRYLGEICAVNPCGELPLPDFGACNLGSLNLLPFLSSSDEDCIDYEEFGKAIRIAVRLMDNIIDLAYYPLPEIQNEQLSCRRIGLGTMGLADLMLKHRIRYGSELSLRLIEKIFSFLRDTAYSESALLAKEKGKFPAYSPEYCKGNFFKTLPKNVRESVVENGIRNSTLLCSAPTGTISILAGASSGIEPVFSFVHERKDRTGTHIVKHWAADFVEDVTNPYLVTASDVTPREHILVQAAIQKYMDSSVSKTINLPNSATVEDVKSAYDLAFASGLKGLTVYRDGSRREQVLTEIVEHPKIADHVNTLPDQLASAELALRGTKVVSGEGRRKMPQEREALTHKFTVGGQEGYITVGKFPDGTPGEIFIHFNKQGSTVAGLADALAVVVSVALQYGTPLDAIIEKMSYRKFEPSGLTSNKDIPLATSLVDYIFRWLGYRFNTEESSNRGHINIGGLGETCPNCGSLLIMSEGCMLCQSCGFSHCL